MEKFYVPCVLFFVTLGLLCLVKPGANLKEQPIVQQPIQMAPVQPEAPKKLETNITTQVPSYLSYENTVAQLQEWQKEAPELTTIGTIGKSSHNIPIYFIRINNPYVKHVKPKVLVTGCIHGNEPHASSTVMGFIGSLLGGYGKDQKITELINNRDIYFVPVLSPDSYPNSRHVDGVDPNRDFTNIKSAPVKAIQEFFLQHKFDAALSGHTWGRVFLFPPGDSMKDTPDHSKFLKVVGKMSDSSGYRNMRACDLYRSGGGLNNPPIRYGYDDWEGSCYSIPIHGSELDWYYKNGAFALVMEFGTHQRIPTKAEIDDEFKRTWPAFLVFCEEAPVALAKFAN